MGARAEQRAVRHARREFDRKVDARSAGPSIDFVLVYEIVQRSHDERRAAREALERRGGMPWNSYETVKAATVAMLHGAVLQVRTPRGALTAGGGRIVDWRTIPSGLIICEGVEAELAIELVIEAGLEAVQRAVEKARGQGETA